MIDDITLTSLKIIETPGGDVMHAMKKSAPGFYGFGEAYFSKIEEHAIKAWKMHRSMTLNIVVPLGEIRFVIFDDRADSDSFRQFREVRLSVKNYQRLTVPPGLWMGFQGLASPYSVLLNMADMEHDPEESDTKTIAEINFDWGNIK